MKDYNDPQEVPGMSEADSKVKRFHTCLDEMLEKYRDQKDDELYAIAVLEGLADGCNQMGLSQKFAADDKHTFLVGMNFSKETRNIEKYVIEKR